MPAVVLTERAGAILLVTLNRPEARNALTPAVTRGVREAFELAATDASVRVVVLSGAGNHFCAGADLKQSFAEDPDFASHLEEYLDEYHAVIAGVVRCPKPVIAMMDGCAVGFGADLALACDLRVASSDAYVQEKFVKIGLMPDGGGTFWLPRLVGTARAMQMILLAEKVEAPEMKELRLVVKVAPPQELREATLALARQLEKGPPLAYAEIKRALYANWGSFEEALKREREGQLKMLRSSDVMEGVMAWTEKREPSFRGV